MSNNEIEQYISSLDKALEEAEEVMLHDKALHDESIIVTDHQGGIRRIAAKTILAERSKVKHGLA